MTRLFFLFFFFCSSIFVILRGSLAENGQVLKSRTVVLTTGTFLRAVIKIGKTRTPAGRIGDESSVKLGDTLISKLGFTTGRLKTGTPPRIRGASVDFHRVQVHLPDPEPVPFSFMNDRVLIDVRLFRFLTSFPKFNYPPLIQP
jgi:tRNA uridine 5-carboxymethylaminomethyl modification enzyme